MEHPSLVFFGSGPVAAASLSLLAAEFPIEAVVTKPRPPHHRGDVPVVDTAVALGLRIIEASNKMELSSVIARQRFESRLAVLIDFGIIVNRDVIDAFPLGIVNSHFSLLPELRGADPITFALLSGQERTGVSLMLLVEAMDEGPLLAFGVQEDITSLTTPELTQKLIGLSHGLLVDTLPKYISGESKPFDQSVPGQNLPWYPSVPTYTRKLTKQDGQLDFTKSARQLEREIRAFIEWPKSHANIANKEVIVTAAHTEQSDETRRIGQIFTTSKQLCVQTSDGVLVIDHLKPAGKPEMTAAAFLAGHKHLMEN